MNLEGLVSKHRDRPYCGGPCRHWVKVKNRNSPAMKRAAEVDWSRCPSVRRKSMKQGLNLFSVIMLIGMATPALGQNVSESDKKAAHDLQNKFVAAFNRQDAVGVAALFTEDGVRVTPQGIIKGREAIRVDLESRFKKNFHDISIESQIVRVSAALAFQCEKPAGLVHYEKREVARDRHRALA
jgi:uncharacterized protein (TIGR02246 family)